MKILMTHMNSKNMRSTRETRFFLVILFQLFSIGYCLADTNSPLLDPTSPTPPRSPTKLDNSVSKVIVKLIQDYHYNGRKLNDEISTLLFDEYFSKLDPNRYFFLESDISEFSQKKIILDDLLVVGNIDFAFEVYRKFLRRIQERVDYVKIIIDNGFDFSIDESFVIDRSEAPWAKSNDELNEIWRKRIKNQLLMYEFQEDEKENEKEDAEISEYSSPREKVLKRYENYFKYFLDNDNADILEYYLTSLLQIFDPHSSYLNWRSIEDFDIHMSLSLQGIGATLRSEDGYTEVVSLVHGGPAYRDGRLQSGDRIIAVGQGAEPPMDVIDMPLKKVVRRIRGAKGTEVRLTVLKTLNSAATIINLIRDEVELKDEEAKGRLESVTNSNNEKINICAIDIPSFYADFDAIKAGDKNPKVTTSDVKRIIDDMSQKENIKGILIDLRSNGGGSLEEAINLTGLFIPEGPVVQVRNRRGIQVRKDTDNGFYYDLPLVVMVNRSSASASEIFSAAIKDYGRGLIVGDRNTHGKGSVQTVLKLNRLNMFKNKKSGAMKYTMAKFYRITGASTQKNGVSPTIVFPSFLDHMEVGESYLKHVMPWDEIEPQKFNMVMDIRPYIPEITQRFNERIEKKDDFQHLIKDIERYGLRSKQKTLTLNKEKRLALREDDEYWAKRSRSILGRRNEENANKEKKKNDLDEDLGRDLYLEESSYILADLIELTNKHKGISGKLGANR